MELKRVPNRAVMSYARFRHDAPSPVLIADNSRLWGAWGTGAEREFIPAYFRRYTSNELFTAGVLTVHPPGPSAAYAAQLAKLAERIPRELDSDVISQVQEILPNGFFLDVVNPATILRSWREQVEMEQFKQRRELERAKASKAVTDRQRNLFAQIHATVQDKGHNADDLIYQGRYVSVDIQTLAALLEIDAHVVP